MWPALTRRHAARRAAVAAAGMAAGVLLLTASGLAGCTGPAQVPRPSVQPSGPATSTIPTSTIPTSTSLPADVGTSPTATGARPAQLPPASQVRAAPAAGAVPPGVTPPGTGPQEVIRTDFGALTGVRVGRHQGFDRIVFEFGTTVPGYRVRFVPLPVKADGSGAAVPLPGATAALEIVFTPASGVNSRVNPPVRTYTGPVRVAGMETVQITDVARIRDVESVLSWASGLRRQVPFTVSTLTNPARVVVDVRHAP